MPGSFSAPTAPLPASNRFSTTASPATSTGGGHTYDLSDAEFVAARDKEFKSSCLALGFPEERIIIPGNRCKDGNATAATITVLLESVLSSFPQGSSFVLSTITPNGDRQHADHRAVGLAALALKASGAFDIQDVVLYLEPYCLNASLAQAYEPIRTDNRTALEAAIECYKLWDVEAGRYAVGFHSVTHEFEDFLANPVAYREISNTAALEPNKVIIIGTNNTTCLGACRCFGSQGVQPYGIIIGDGKGYVTKSKYWKSIVSIESHDELLKALKAFWNLPKKPVLISTTDTATMLMDNCYSELAEHFILPNIKETPGLILPWMNKKKQESLTQDIGGTVLPSETVNTADVKVPSFGFPVMIKPLDSIGGGKGHMAVCENEEQLQSHLAKLHEQGLSEVMMQRYLDHPKEYIVHGCVDSKKHFKMFSIISNDRSYPYKNGVGSYSRFVNDPAAFSYFERIFDGVMDFGYSGPLDIDVFVIDDEDNPFIICEYNWRVGGKCFTDLASGTPSLYSWYLSVTDQDPCPGSSRKAAGAIMCEDPDLWHVIRGNITLRKWLWEYRRAKCYGLRWDDDPEPQVIRYRWLLKHYEKKYGSSLFLRGTRFLMRKRGHF